MWRRIWCREPCAPRTLPGGSNVVAGRASRLAERSASLVYSTTGTWLKDSTRGGPSNVWVQCPAASTRKTVSAGALLWVGPNGGPDHNGHPSGQLCSGTPACGFDENWMPDERTQPVALASGQGVRSFGRGSPPKGGVWCVVNGSRLTGSRMHRICIRVAWATKPGAVGPTSTIGASETSVDSTARVCPLGLGRYAWMDFPPPISVPNADARVADRTRQR
jgi:hypothetical protein